LSPRQKPNPEAGKAKYQPTARELAALTEVYDANGRDPAPKADQKGAAVALDHPDPLFGQALLIEALGTAGLRARAAAMSLHELTRREYVPHETFVRRK
jgi:hypothetical protein